MFYIDGMTFSFVLMVNSVFLVHYEVGEGISSPLNKENGAHPKMD